MNYQRNIMQGEVLFLGGVGMKWVSLPFFDKMDFGAGQRISDNNL